MAEAQFDRPALAEFHRSAGQPLATLFGIDEKLPHGLDRAGQQALEAHFGGRDDAPIGGVGHLRLLFVLRAWRSSAVSSASRRTVQKRWYQAIQRSASASARASRRQRCVRPSMVRLRSPAPSSTFTCLAAAAKDMSKGRASSPTLCSPAASFRSMARRVGSARAWETRSRPAAVCSTMWLNIGNAGKYSTILL